MRFFVTVRDLDCPETFREVDYNETLSLNSLGNGVYLYDPELDCPYQFLPSKYMNSLLIPSVHRVGGWVSASGSGEVYLWV